MSDESIADNAGDDQPSAEAPLPSIWSIWPFRLIFLIVVLIGVALGAQFIPSFFGQAVAQIPKPALSAIVGIVTAVVLIYSYRVLVHWTEKRNAVELGTAHLTSLVLRGILTGFLLFCTVYAILFGLGVATFKGLLSGDGLVTTAAGALTAGVGEEIVFRGVVFRVIEEGMGTLIALIVSAALFGLLHAMNPGASVVSTVAIMLEAGVLLAAAYTLTRSLWFPIGLHFAWNFTEGGIFGAAVSGGRSHGLLNIPLQGPDILTGGQFGPEASIVAIAVCFGLALVMLVIAARRGHWKPMQWRLRTA